MNFKLIKNQMAPKHLLIGLFFCFACSSKKESTLDVVAYKAEIEKWHAERVDNDLKGPHGWLNLAGLFWLNEGFNTFGSGDTNDILFPKGKIDEQAGTFVVKNGEVTLQAQPGVEIKIDTTLISSQVIYSKDMERAPLLKHGMLEWLVISRGGKLAVRLRDLDSDAVKNFHGVERYPVDPMWRIEGKFQKYDESKTIDITNILGQTYPQPNPGLLIFNIGDKEFQLDALSEGGPEYFIIFGDQTNEHETYPSGRYMYVEPEDENGNVVIDFNKSYNPPCAFTEFATCPLPPKQNVLDVAITAGEKNFGDH